MTGDSNTRAKHFQPIINFLTETIDRSFSREEKLRQAVSANHVEDHGQLAEIRGRRDAAYRALEKVLEVVLHDIRSRSDEVDAELMAPRLCIQSEEFMDSVFPEDDAGHDLKQRFLRNMEA